MLCLAQIYGSSAGLNATTATALAASTGLAKLSEADLWAVLLSILC